MEEEKLKHNARDYMLLGIETYKDEKCTDNNAIYYFEKAINDDKIWYVDKINSLFYLSTIYIEYKDYEKALYYAMNAATLTFSPRADICMLIGDIYFSMKNYKWSIFWYEKTIGNVSYGSEADGLNVDELSYLPLLKLTKIYCDIYEDYEKAKEYNDAVLLLKPENEIAQENKKYIDSHFNAQ